MENNNKEREIMTTEEDIDEKNYPENNKNKKYDESRVYYVYKHVRLDNNTCFYIGKGKNGRKDVPNRNPTHDSICDRHDYKVVIFKDNLNEKEAFKLEEDLIRCYVFKMGYGILIKGYMNNNNKFLTNRTWGGEGVSGMHHTEEVKQNMSEKRKGKPSPNKGKKQSEEAKQKMSESHKGKTPWNKGRQLSEEHKQNLSESHKGKMAGEKHPMWGKIPWNKGKKGLQYHSEEAKQRMSESHKGKPAPNRIKIICITTGKTFDSITEASNWYNVAISSISACCRKKIQSAGKLNGIKLQWKYLEDDDNESKAV